MSDTDNQATELEVLKSRARMMGIEFSNNIRAETLRERINAKLNDLPPEPEPAETDELEPNALNQGAETVTVPNTDAAPKVATNTDPVKRKLSHREQLIADATRLVRLRITNLNPQKKDLPGEILTVANEYIGTIRKFIPFGEATENGYHVPYCLYQMMDERKFLHIQTKKHKETNTPQVSARWVREFSLEILDPLTPEEITNLAQAQIAAGSIEVENAL